MDEEFERKTEEKAQLVPPPTDCTRHWHATTTSASPAPTTSVIALAVGPFVRSGTRPTNPRHRHGRSGYRRGSSDEDLGAAPASERARSNKRLKLAARVDYGMNLSSARRSLSAIR